MADFDIKPASGTGNSLRLKNEAGNIVLSTNNGTGASSWGAVAPAGTVVNVQQAVFKGNYSDGTADTWKDLSNGSGNELKVTTATPLNSSSKFLIRVNLGAVFIDDASNIVYFRILRDSTAVGVGDDAGSRIPCYGAFRGAYKEDINGCGPFSMEYLDSPSSSSAIVYKAQWRINGSTFYANYAKADSDSSHFPRAISTITVTEIAG